MLTNVLTCIGTGSLGVGVGLVINTFRNRKRKASELQNSKVDKSPHEDTSTKKVMNPKLKLRIMYGLQSHFDVLDKYIHSSENEELHAQKMLLRYIDRILEINEKANSQETKKMKYWNPAGAISANATKVKLWLKTITHLLKSRLGDNLPEELNESISYLQEYIAAEQYNKLLDYS